MEAYREYVGCPHTHSIYSDGEADYATIARAAEAADLNFIILTDHNIRPQGLERYYGRILVLTGEEIHNVRRQPQANHLLAYGTGQEMTPYSFGSPQTLIQKVKESEGFCYIAHPVEKGRAFRPDLAPIPWTNWPTENISGLEIWNYMSEFKHLMWSRFTALIYTFLPEIGIRGPHRATLKLWDELLAKGQRLSALGSADAHGTPYNIGPFKRVIFPYDYLFRCVTTHILTKGPLTGDLEQDKAVIYEALNQGRTWVAYDLPASSRGFQFYARSGSARATIGEELKRLGAISLNIKMPARAEVKLLRDGKVIRHTRKTAYEYTSAEPGIYRVEAYRNFRGRRVGWIFSSPIYVT
jgi:hypothetical protein